MIFEVGERVAIIGENGVGKTTLMRCLQGDLQPDTGEVKWSENSKIGYYAQEHSSDFESELNLFDWMSQWRREGDDEQTIRSFLGRMLFSADDIKKTVTCYPVVNRVVCYSARS